MKYLFLLVGGSAALAIAVALFFLARSQSTTVIDTARGPETTYAAGESFVTYVESKGIGKIAVRVTLPSRPRYDVGAPVVIYVPTFFTPKESFEYQFEIDEYGVALVSFLYPGRADEQSGARSQGENDYGGEDSMAAFRDVIKFVSGELNNVDGFTLDELAQIEMLENNVGLYAFSHPGIAATNVMAYFGDELQNVSYIVGRENPTVDTLYPLELGHFEGKTPVVNPIYEYPDSYSAKAIDLDYSTLRYDSERAVPYFDMDGDGVAQTRIDYVFGEQVPRLFGKRYYSQGLLEALQRNGALSLANWPDDMATPIEAARDWPYRETVDHYDELAALGEQLHVMLVFGKRDHVQPTQDKPHVHQAYDGFTSAGIWTRLNPDAAYVREIDNRLAQQYYERAAQTQPDDWSDASLWGHTDVAGATTLVPYAAVLEMADRTQNADWSDNLDEPLVTW